MFSINNLKRYTLAIWFACSFFYSFSQATSPTSTCNIQVYIDSIVVNPCFRTGGGGACGCNNTLWAVVNGGTAPYSYHWTPNGETTDSIFNVCYVEFSVKVTDANGCVAYDSLNVVIPRIVDTTTTDTLSAVTGISNYYKTNSIAIFPSPTTDKLFISFSNAIKSNLVEIYNLQGEKMLSQNTFIGVKSISIDISSLAEGTYILRVNDSGKPISKKFIKAK